MVAASGHSSLSLQVLALNRLEDLPKTEPDTRSPAYLEPGHCGTSLVSNDGHAATPAVIEVTAGYLLQVLVLRLALANANAPLNTGVDFYEFWVRIGRPLEIYQDASCGKPAPGCGRVEGCARGESRE